MRRWEAAALIVVGTVATAVTCAALTASVDGAVMLTAFLLMGPAWALSFCAVSDEEDFAGASRSRGDWLRILPWTFLLAPLVVPNVFVLGAFFRDSRADGGRSPLTWDRMRPGDGDRR